MIKMPAFGIGMAQAMTIRASTCGGAAVLGNRSRFMCTHSNRWQSVKRVTEDREFGKDAVVKGWVKSVRRQKKFSFLQVSDGSSCGNLQLVSKTADVPADVHTGCSVVATGKCAEGRNDTVEVFCDSVELVGVCDPGEYPLQKKYHSPEFLREIVHLRPRSNRIGAVLRIRSAAALAIHNYFSSQEFVSIHSPILTTIDCEGAGEMFVAKLPHDGKNQNDDALAYLTVSAQLHAEIFATALSRVYTFGPTFRAENSNTKKHLYEFWMIEPEVAFHDLEDAMALAEGCIKHVIHTVFAQHKPDLDYLFQCVGDEDPERCELKMADLVRARDEPFLRVTYSECIDLLQKSGVEFEHGVDWKNGLQAEHEHYLVEQHFDRKPVFVTDYPAQCKAFYMKQHPDDPSVVRCFDLLVPRIGELVGGSEREDNVDILEKKMTSVFENNTSLEWYLDLRRYGSVPHAGWGMGFERLVQFVTGVENIRDSIPVPRSPGSIYL